MSQHTQETLVLSHASVRILHNIGNSGSLVSPRVDVYLGSKVIAYNLSYGDFTAYISVQAGDHILTAKQANSDIIVAQGRVRFYDDAYYTAVVAGDLNDSQSTEIIVNQDNLRCPRPGYSSVRFIQGAAGFGNVDVYSGDDLIFSNVAFGQSTSYKQFKLGYAKLGVVRTGQPISTKTEIANPYLVSGAVYSVVLSLNAPSNPQPEYVLRGVVTDDTRGACENIQENFNLPAYMGKWYVISSIPQVYDSNCPRATAEYTLLQSGGDATSPQDYVRVVNTCYNEDWVTMNSISGRGIQQPCDAASFHVSFPNIEATPGPNYLVHSTDYTGYAVVGSPNRSALWILSRKSKMCVEQYQQLVRNIRRLGYDVSTLRIYYHALTRRSNRGRSK